MRHSIIERVTLLVRLFILTILTTNFVHANKQLVLFAGPHYTGASSVEQFYHNFASGYNNAKTANSLDGWVWPRIQGDLGLKNKQFERPKVFQFLVTRADNDQVQENLKTAIREAYGRANEGVIIGTEEFDRIGDTPYSHLDGLKAMEEVVNFLRVDQEDVWVVLNYRTPRVEQWISYWKHMVHDPTYEQFLCNNYNQVWEMLDTGMNPLGLARTIRHETGWNVVLIDMVGAQDLGSDISHIIACEILGNTNCNGGFLADRYNRTYHNNHIEDKDFDGLDEHQLDQLETLLRKRDCGYQEQLRNDHGFYVLHESTLWQGCNKKDPTASYTKLKDTTVLLDLFQSQLKCKCYKDHAMEDYILESDNYEALTAKKTLAQLQKEMAANQFENLEAFEIDEETQAAMNNNKNKQQASLVHQKAKDDEDMSEGNSVLNAFFVLMLVGAGAVYKLYVARSKVNDGSDRLWYNRLKHQNSYLTRENDLDAEYGDATASDNDDNNNNRGGKKSSTSRNRFKTYKDDTQWSSDDDASNYSEGLELPTTDWTNERDDEDYYDNTTEMAQERQARNRIMMQMPRSSFMGPRRPNNNNNNNNRSRGGGNNRRNKARERRDLDWAMADKEMESSDEENDSSSSDSDNNDVRRSSRGGQRMGGRRRNNNKSGQRRRNDYYDDEY